VTTYFKPRTISTYSQRKRRTVNNNPRTSTTQPSPNWTRNTPQLDNPPSASPRSLIGHSNFYSATPPRPCRTHRNVNPPHGTTTPTEYTGTTNTCSNDRRQQGNTTFLQTPLPHPSGKLHTFNLVLSYTVLRGPGSSVGVATGYGMDGPEIESRWKRDFPHLSRPALGPTQPPVQCVPGLFLGVGLGRGVTLTPQPLLVPRSKKQSRAIPVVSRRAFVACEKG
jgi:hypothetical protein